MYNREKENNAHKARYDRDFKDDRSETVKEKGPSGSYHETTYYSDGSSTVNFGGMGGQMDYDNNGDEC